MVAKLRMATNGRQKNADGNWETSTDWHNVVAFGKTAELVDNYAPKGKEIVVEGRLQTRNYEDRDGNKRYATEVIADNIELVGARVEKTNNETHSNNGGELEIPF
jgi:single-strand DNA-binding protein